MKIIINLLPQEHKDAHNFRRKCNVAFKLSVMASIAVVVYVVFIISCIQIIDMEKRTVAQEIQRTKGDKGYLTIKSDQELIKDYYNMAGIIEKGFSKEKTFLSLFDMLNSIAPAGITLEQVRVDAKTATIKGVGKQRQEVIDFKEKLEQEKSFSKVDSPISNFTRQSDVTFEFILTFKDPTKSDDK